MTGKKRKEWVKRTVKYILQTPACECEIEVYSSIVQMTSYIISFVLVDVFKSADDLANAER